VPSAILRFLCGTSGAVALLQLLILFPSQASADETRGTLLVVFENDLFYRTDRDYTNGAEISWTPPYRGQDQLPDLAAVFVPFFFDPANVRASYSIGQMMFTPEHTALVDPPPGERPYAGYLYGALALSDEKETARDMLRLQLGVVGPASLAADSQEFVHTIRGFAVPRGWHAQLRDEPGLVLTYERTREIGRLANQDGKVFDVRAHFGGAIGNVFDYANLGATARLGINLPSDDGPARMEPSAPGSYIYAPQAGLGAYLFAGLEGRLVARDIFLDGNSFRRGPSVEKEPAVGDVLLGAAIAIEGARLSFVHVFRSREYVRQKGFDQFGTLSLSTNF